MGLISRRKWAHQNERPSPTITAAAATGWCRRERGADVVGDEIHSQQVAAGEHGQGCDDTANDQRDATVHLGFEGELGVGGAFRHGVGLGAGGWWRVTSFWSGRGLVVGGVHHSVGSLRVERLAGRGWCGLIR